MFHEQQRLNFVVSRDGLEGAKAFARQSLSVYRKALKTNYGKAYRRALVESCLDFRMFLRVAND